MLEPVRTSVRTRQNSIQINLNRGNDKAPKT